MKIVVLNGSPKGPVSVTMQYVSYIAKRHPEHDLKVFHVAQKINGLVKDPGRFEAIIEEIRRRRTVGLPPVHPAGQLAVQTLHRAD